MARIGDKYMHLQELKKAVIQKTVLKKWCPLGYEESETIKQQTDYVPLISLVIVPGFLELQKKLSELNMSTSLSVVIL